MKPYNHKFLDFSMYKIELHMLAKYVTNYIIDFLLYFFSLFFYIMFFIINDQATKIDNYRYFI
jgi:hypothetical protein